MSLSACYSLGYLFRTGKFMITRESASAGLTANPAAHIATKRVGINAHLLSNESTYRRAGIHQYIYQSLRNLPTDGDGPQIVLFAPRIEGMADTSQSFSVVYSRWPTERRLVRIAWEQIAWPWLSWRHQIDLLHGMAFVTPVLSPCPTVVTVYDLSFIRFPDRFPAVQRVFLASQTRRSCRSARRVITISDSTRQDVNRLFGVSLDRVDVVRPGVDASYRPLPAADVLSFRKRKGLPERFALHVGTLQPRKNIPILLDALAKITHVDLPLVLVGGKGWMFDEIYRRVEALRIGGRVRFTGYVPDAELPLWYNAATLLVFASVYEGFGMPVVEAMACGTPVIAADTSSIPEAAGNAAILFDPRDPDELADRMAAVLYDANLAATMQEQGLRHARRFSWEHAGLEIAAVYRKALIEHEK